MINKVYSFCLIGILAVLIAGCGNNAQVKPTPVATATTANTASETTASQTLKYAVFPAPPYMIGADDEKAEISGIDVDIAKEIAKQLNLKVEFIRCPWARCLDLMKKGEADLLSSAYKKPDREEYMHYLDIPFLDKLPIAFYYLKGKTYTIDKYEDIYQFQGIGILRGASYFEQFDKDTKAKKYEVTSQDQLFPMLLKERFEIMAGYVPTENYRIATEGYHDKVQRSKYEFAERADVYMAISKKSPLAPRIGEINKINKQLFDDGVITKIMNSYYEKYQ